MDLEGIRDLMHAGFTFQECLSLLKTKENAKAIEAIETRIENGEPLESFFPSFCPHAQGALLSGFLNVIPLAESIRLSVEIHKERSALKREYEKGLLYPMLLLPLACTGLVFFERFCFPTLISLLESFHADTSSYHSIQILLHGISTAFFLSTASLAVTFVLIKLLHKEVSYYKWITKVHPDSLYTQYQSEQFVLFYLECIRTGLSTRDTLSILCNLNGQPVILFLARFMRQQLNTGHSFEKALMNPYIDPVLSKYLKIGFYADTMEQLLLAYLNQAKLRSRRLCKKITHTFEVLAYSIIGLLLILVYEILLAPMEILSQI